MRQKMLEIDLFERFGPVCGDGALSLKMLREEVIPALEKYQSVEFRCGGVRVMSSSFSNALFANLVADKGHGVTSHIRILEAASIVKAEIRSAFQLGLRRHIVRDVDAPEP